MTSHRHNISLRQPKTQNAHNAHNARMFVLDERERSHSFAYFAHDISWREEGRTMYRTHNNCIKYHSEIFMLLCCFYRDTGTILRCDQSSTEKFVPIVGIKYFTYFLDTAKNVLRPTYRDEFWGTARQRSREVDF